jgi:hypothetical protein
VTPYKSDHREQESHRPEETRETSNGALLIKRHLYLLLHRPDAGDGEVGIDFRDRAPHLGLEEFGK